MDKFQENGSKEEEGEQYKIHKKCDTLTFLFRLHIKMIKGFETFDFNFF